MRPSGTPNWQEGAAACSHHTEQTRIWDGSSTSGLISALGSVVPQGHPEPRFL